MIWGVSSDARTTMRDCVADENDGPDSAARAGRERLTVDELEKLFLTLS